LIAAGRGTWYEDQVLLRLRDQSREIAVRECEWMIR